jgi:drug/metabolite transporter (DMT)-like permease
MTASPQIGGRGARRFEAILPYGLLAISQLSWAGNWVIGRAVRDLVPPVALTFWRWSIAALVLAPFALPRLRGQSGVLKRHWGVLLLLGVSGAGFFQAMVYTGLRYTEAVNATLMNSASPLFIIIIAWLMAVERVSLRQLSGMLLSFCGILVILNRGDIGQLRDFRFNPGDLLILLAMPAWGFYCVLLQRRPAELDGIAFLFVICLVGALALAPFYALESAFIRVPQITLGSVAAILYVGLFASVLSYGLWNRGVAMIGPSRAGFTNHLLPAFTAGLAIILLGEKLRVFHVVGVATILAGVWIATSAPPPTAD